MNPIVNNIKQRLSLREPLVDALRVLARLTDKLTLKKYSYNKECNIKYNEEIEYKLYLDNQLRLAKEVCPFCKDFERYFPSFAFSIATGIGKTRLMAACIAYLYLEKGIRHFFIIAPNLTLYEKLIKDFGDPSYEKYVFKGLSEFVHNTPVVITGDNYEKTRAFFSDKEIQINIFNISKFNTDSKENAKKGIPKMRRLSEYIGQSYFEYLSQLEDLVILMDEAHRYHADASKNAINELRPILGLEMTATPIDEKNRAFKNIVYEYNLAQALDDGKYVKIPTVAKRKNFDKKNMSDEELDALKIGDAISIHERTKINIELYAKNNNLPIVKPFILVVCRDIEHAKRTKVLIEDEMYNGKYRGKVLQIDSSTKKNEEIERLFISLENIDNEIEIVIHVNMLKEGWDVNNLYTIVPLRVANAPVLVEQSIGRGLRLPYGGRRTENPDIDKLTVIAHDNFESVIKKAEDKNSVFSRYKYAEIDDEDFNHEQAKVISVQTIFDVKQEELISTARACVEKQEAMHMSDAIRAVFSVIPKANTQVKNKKELARPEIKEYIRRQAVKAIQLSAKKVNPLFAEELATEYIKSVDAVIDMAVEKFIDNIIEIPRMTIQKEIYRAEYKWFDLDVSFGFDLPTLADEIIRVNIGAGVKSVEAFQIYTERKFDKPLNVIVESLTEYDDIDYDENSELLYHLASQAIDAIFVNLDIKDDLPKVVFKFKRAIAANIYNQMQRHFVITSTGYVKPQILPFVGIIEQNIKEIEGYGRIDYRNIVSPMHLRKFIFTGYLKSYYTEYKFDSKTEHDFSFVLENDSRVLRWLRPAKEQFNIYWANGSRRYEPDFIVETSEMIYMIETKAVNELIAEEVQMKKNAAEEFCRYASEFTIENGGKPWRYILLPHNEVDRTFSFEYLIAKYH